MSLLCQTDAWSRLDVNRLAQLYNSEITMLLDQLDLSHTVGVRRTLGSTMSAVRLNDLLGNSSAPFIDAPAATAALVAQRRDYATLRQRKREMFWRNKIDIESKNPRQLWRSVDALMGRRCIPPCDTINATEFHRFFDAKVDGVRATTANAPPPSFSTVPPGCSLHAFQSLVVEDVVAAIRALPDEQSADDPPLTRLLKENVDVLAPFLVELHNWSLQTGSVPTSLKSAYITPLLKKTNFDPADPKSYRPIANLSTLSKLLERLVTRQFVSYLNAALLLPDLQSAYRAHHSTETAVTKVLSNILTALDTGDISTLTLLDLSAAFNTVNHDILLRRLAVSYSLGGTVLELVSVVPRRPHTVRPPQ